MANQGDIHADHRERMHRRFLQSGFDGFAEHEALEYILFFSIPRKDVNPLAHRLIEHFGGFDRVLEASEPELLAVEGVGPATAKLLTMIMQADRYYQRTRAQLPKMFGSLEEIHASMLPLFYGAVNEQVYAMFLDDRNHPLRLLKVAEGSTNDTAFSKRGLAQQAVRLGATQLVLAHNHPMGTGMPSAQDIDFTDQLGRLLGALGIRLLDHIIVDPAGDYVSLRQSNRMLQRYSPEQY